MSEVVDQLELVTGEDRVDDAQTLVHRALDRVAKDAEIGSRIDVET